MLFAALGVYLPVWWLTTGWGNHGLWFAMISLMLARALSMGLVYLHFDRQGRWFRNNEGS